MNARIGRFFGVAFGRMAAKKRKPDPSRRRKRTGTFIPSAADSLRAFRVSAANQLIGVLKYYIRKEGQTAPGGSLGPQIEEVLDLYARQQEEHLFAMFFHNMDVYAAKVLESIVTPRELVEHVRDEWRARIYGAPWDESGDPAKVNVNKMIGEINRILSSKRTKTLAKQRLIAEVLTRGVSPPDIRDGVRKHRAEDLEEAGAVYRPPLPGCTVTRVELKLPVEPDRTT